MMGKIIRSVWWMCVAAAVSETDGGRSGNPRVLYQVKNGEKEPYDRSPRPIPMIGY